MNYREEVKRTCPQIDTDSFADKLRLGLMGLVGESGEFVDLVKKDLFHGKKLDREKALKELGDIRWYLEYLAMTFDVPSFVSQIGLCPQSTAKETMTLIFFVGELSSRAALVFDFPEPQKHLSKHHMPLLLTRIYETLEHLALSLGSTAPGVEDMNITKLRARYPEGFNFAAAAARADEGKSL